jgi:hypothetical protein
MNEAAVASSSMSARDVARSSNQFNIRCSDSCSGLRIPMQCGTAAGKGARHFRKCQSEHTLFETSAMRWS